MIKNMDQFNGLNITFHLSNQCNMRCKYCYELDKHTDSLKIEDAKKFIDIMLTDPDPVGLKGHRDEWIMNSGLIMDFIGGDPLAEVELMDEIVQYFIFKSVLLKHRWRSNYRISLSTNGTYFGQQKVRDFMNKYKGVLSVGVSLDGSPEIHDLNRIMPDGSGSMKLIKDNWDWYCNWLGIPPSTKATLNKESIPFLYESIKYLYEDMGIKWISANFIFEDMGLSEQDLKELDDQLELLKQYTLKHADDIYVSLLDERWNNTSCMTDPERGWCGSGAMPALDTNGKIYPCFRFCPQNMANKDWDMSVGDVENGFNRKENFLKIRNLSRDLISPDMCRDCEIESACAYCIASSYAESGELYRQTNICKVHKLQAKHAKDYWRLYNDRI